MMFGPPAKFFRILISRLIFFFFTGLRIFTTHLSLLVTLMASNTSEYFPRPSFRTSWKRNFLKQGRLTFAYLIVVLITPLNNVALVVPVLARAVGVRFRVVSSPGRRDHSKAKARISRYISREVIKLYGSLGNTVNFELSITCASSL